jgi:hypothetical protein
MTNRALVWISCYTSGGTRIIHANRNIAANRCTTTMPVKNGQNVLSMAMLKNHQPK